MADTSSSPEPSVAKRPLEDAADPAARKKKARTSASAVVQCDAKSVLAMEDTQLSALSQADAIACLTNLKSAYIQLYAECVAVKKAAAARPAPAAGASAAAPTWTPAKIVEVATRVRKNTHDAIMKQMKWQPTCRKGTTKWSISVLASAPEVMKAALGLPANEKEFKLKKLTMDEFERAFGTIHVSIRYGSLYVTGKTVTLRWDPSSCEFTLNGTYGLPQ